jgi:TolA-binding protein
MNDNLEELKQQKSELEEQIFLVETQTERQKLEDLENEVKLGRARVKELETEAYEISIANQAEIKTHLAEVERLKLESFDITADAWELQNRLQGKQIELIKLRETIEKSKIFV